MGLDLGLRLKTSARYGHLGYLGHIFDPKKIFRFFAHSTPFMPIRAKHSFSPTLKPNTLLYKNLINDAPKYKSQF